MSPAIKELLIMVATSVALVIFTELATVDQSVLDNPMVWLAYLAPQLLRAAGAAGLNWLRQHYQIAA